MKGFVVPPRRWVGRAHFSWFGRNRPSRQGSQEPRRNPGPPSLPSPLSSWPSGGLFGGSPDLLCRHGGRRCGWAANQIVVGGKTGGRYRDGAHLPPAEMRRLRGSADNGRPDRQLWIRRRRRRAGSLHRRAVDVGSVRRPSPDPAAISEPRGNQPFPCYGSVYFRLLASPSTRRSPYCRPLAGVIHTLAYQSLPTSMSNPALASGWRVLISSLTTAIALLPIHARGIFIINSRFRLADRPKPNGRCRSDSRPSPRRAGLSEMRR